MGEGAEVVDEVEADLEEETGGKKRGREMLLLSVSLVVLVSWDRERTWVDGVATEGEVGDRDGECLLWVGDSCQMVFRGLALYNKCQ